MTGKRKSVFSLFLSFAVSVFLCAGLALTANAADDYASGVDSDFPAQAAITKLFKMPASTPTPAANFQFVFSKVGMDEPLDTTRNATMPDLGPVAVSYSAGETPVGGVFTVGDTKTVAKESANFLAGKVGAGVWQNGEGIYKYTVSENSGAPTGITNIAGTINNGTTFSSAIYDLEIWVEEDGAGILYPKYVIAKVRPGNLDEYYDGGTPGSGKVPPTPGGVKEVAGDPTIEDDFSQMVFTNKYWDSTGGGTTDPSLRPLTITKKITGNGANLSDYFSFDVTVTKPSLLPAATTPVYAAYIVGADDVILTDVSANNVNTYPTTLDGIGNPYFSFTSGMPMTFKLTHNQKLVFVDLHTGAAVSVTEAADSDYTASYTRNFSNPSALSFKAPAVNTAWGFPRDPGDVGPHFIATGNGNTATFTNTRTGATPTGININDLPFVILIAVILLAIAGFAVFRYRRSRRHQHTTQS